MDRTVSPGSPKLVLRGGGWLSRVLDRCIYDEESAKRVKFAFDKGHQIASHTWSHAHLKELSHDQREYKAGVFLSFFQSA